VVVDPRTTLPRDIASVSAAHHSRGRQVTALVLMVGYESG
jgi:LacI family transcriptional regulator